MERYQKVGSRKDVLEEAIASAGTTELAFLDRGLPILAAVSTIAPILGFLGTVAGMIGAFNAIAIAGEVEPTLRLLSRESHQRRGPRHPAGPFLW